MRPDTAANVGATARAMRNAGLADLVLVSPGDWRTLDAWRTAWGAHDVLERARVCATLDEALSGCTWTAALTGRLRDGRVVDVRDMAAELAAHPGPAALVFGPESAGLTDAEIASCGHAVGIPSHPDQPSLNLSHAVMVTVYELHRARAAAPAPGPFATHDARQEALGLLREGLRAIGALPVQDETRRMNAWAGLVHRADLTPGEVRMIEHVARRMAHAGRR